MFRIERQEKVLNYINENKTVKTQELAKAFGASLVTIRNDINELANRGLIIKTHGGAVCCQHRSNMEIPSVIRFQENIVSKQAIASITSDLIEDGDVIILDSGSTTLEIAKRIKGKNLTVSPPHTRSWVRRPSTSLIPSGSRSSSSAVTPSTSSGVSATAPWRKCR